MAAHVSVFGKSCRSALAAAALMVVVPAVVTAQKTPVAGAQRATRAQLEQLLGRATAQLASAKSSEKARVQEQISRVRSRLDEGDFKPGDRFVLTLRQDSVQSDTLIVRDSLRVAVLNLPEFSVSGVLRSELEDKLTAHIARFLRNANVRATLLTRVAVTGAVTKPGFYYAIPDRPLNDLITSAGGPAGGAPGEADLGRLTISRAGKTMISGKQAKRIIEEGQTLELLDVQSGDTVHVPVKRRVNWQLVIQLAFIVTSLMFAFLQFLQWYYNRQDS